jgi:hypothetical protein
MWFAMLSERVIKDDEVAEVRERRRRATAFILPARTHLNLMS